MAENKAKHSYKLIYFNSRGAAELSRLVFKAADVDFIDERIPREEWPSRKQDMPLNALPVLEIDGRKVCQSAAIARFLAREFGLMGSSNLESLSIDELLEVFTEMTSRDITKIYYEHDEVKKKEMATAFSVEKMPSFMDFFELRLKENNGGNGFYVGDKLSLGDLILYNGIHLLSSFLGRLGVDLLSSRPLLKAHTDRVEAEPRIAEWIKVRPQTDM